MYFSTIISVMFILFVQNYCGINPVLGANDEKLKEITNNLFANMYGAKVVGPHNTNYCAIYYENGGTTKDALEGNANSFLTKGYEDDKLDFYKETIRKAMESFQDYLGYANHGPYTDLLKLFQEAIETKKNSLERTTKS